MISKEHLKELTKRLAQAAFDKKGEEIKLLDMEGVSYIADYFILVNANNTKMTQSIADEISDKAAELGIDLKHTEGYREGDWVLLDFGDIVCHVFTKEQREFYGLDQLWNDAVVVPFEGV